MPLRRGDETYRRENGEESRHCLKIATCQLELLFPQQPINDGSLAITRTCFFKLGLHVGCFCLLSALKSGDLLSNS